MNKLKQIERKLIVGGENMLEKAEKQARLLEQSNAELERGRANESQLRQALAEKNQERSTFQLSVDVFLDVRGGIFFLLHDVRVTVLLQQFDFNFLICKLEFSVQMRILMKTIL